MQFIDKEFINKKRSSGFTLIELLVVISIVGILIGLSVFGLQGARETSRDAKRKSDLELIRSGIEIYKSDCNHYPISSVQDPIDAFGTSLVGDGVICNVTNTYITQVPTDPIPQNMNYLYYSDGVTYEICASLEQVPSTGTVTCGGSSSCGSGTSCNYKVINP